MQETQIWSLGWEDPLEKEMATHSGILAWPLPWTEEPGGLQSIELQRVDTTERLNNNNNSSNTWKTSFIRNISSSLLVPFLPISVPPALGVVPASCSCCFYAALELWSSECGPQSSSISICWELVRNTSFWPHPRSIRLWWLSSAVRLLTSPPGSLAKVWEPLP